MALKSWSNGNVFYGADMDSFVRASIMRYADAATRTSIMTGDLAPAAGMLSALQSDHYTYRYGSAGAWQYPPGTVMFMHALTSGQVIAHNTWTVVLGWNQQARNLNTWLNVSNGRFTPQLAGLYELYGGVCYYQGSGETGGMRQAAIRLNGTVLPASVMETANTFTVSYTYVETKPVTVSMNGSTDYADLATLQTSTLTINQGQAATKATIFVGTYQGS